MLTNNDRRVARKKKKIWDSFDWGYRGKGIGFFKNHRSLSCGCGMCKLIQWHKKWENKRDRSKAKLDLKSIIN